MTETSDSLDISTELERIAKQAKEIRDGQLCTLAHHIDVEWMREAFRRAGATYLTHVARKLSIQPRRES